MRSRSISVQLGLRGTGHFLRGQRDL